MPTWKEAIATAEDRVINEPLRRSACDRLAAARLLEISPAKLYRKITMEQRSNRTNGVTPPPPEDSHN